MPPARLNRKTILAEPLPLEAEKVQGVQQGLLDWYRRGHRDLPWRNTRDPYAILVSEIMLQQTQVERVIPKYHQFLGLYPTLEALAAAPRAEVIRNWSPLGYNVRAVRLHEIARQAVATYGGRLPETIPELLSLKGIGPYTAGAIACFAFGQATAALDTNVRRVLGRIFAADLPGAAVDDRLAWRLAEAVLPPSDAYVWNQALMDLGATTCIARSPRCLLCPLQSLCSAREAWTAPGTTETSSLPMATLPLAAESKASYVAGRRPTGQPAPPVVASERFEGSRRWYRGRIVDALRAMPPGEALSVEALGPQIKPDFAPADRPWLLDLARALAHDGLIEIGGPLDAPVLTLPT
jgi:A/G-specific adenine glycosylase